MPEKSRRGKDREIRLSETQLRHPGMEKAFAEVSVETPSDEAGLEQEYQYVVADLRRIGLIALVMLAGLVGLTFFLV